MTACPHLAPAQPAGGHGQPRWDGNTACDARCPLCGSKGLRAIQQRTVHCFHEKYGVGARTTTILSGPARVAQAAAAQCVAAAATSTAAKTGIARVCTILAVHLNEGATPTNAS